MFGARWPDGYGPPQIPLRQAAAALATTRTISLTKKPPAMTEAPFGVSASSPRSVPELGQTVRWRGARWRVAGIGERGVIRLRGLDAAFRDVEVTPLTTLEGRSFQPDELPLPKLEVEATDRGRWRALHRAHQITMAGGREQMVGLDWGAIAVEPYQLVPLMRVARTMRPRLLGHEAAGVGHDPSGRGARGSPPGALRRRQRRGQPRPLALAAHTIPVAVESMRVASDHAEAAVCDLPTSEIGRGGGMHTSG